MKATMTTFVSITGTPAEARRAAKQTGLPVVLHNFRAGGVYLPSGRSFVPSGSDGGTRLTYGPEVVRTLREAGCDAAADEVEASFAR